MDQLLIFFEIEYNDYYTNIGWLTGNKNKIKSLEKSPTRAIVWHGISLETG